MKFWKNCQIWPIFQKFSIILKVGVVIQPEIYYTVLFLVLFNQTDWVYGGGKKQTLYATILIGSLRDVKLIYKNWPTVYWSNFKASRSSVEKVTRNENFNTFLFFSHCRCKLIVSNEKTSRDLKCEIPLNVR